MLIKKALSALVYSLFFICITVVPASAVDGITTDTQISWTTGDIVITASAAIPDSATNITTTRFRLTESIDRDLTEIVTNAFKAIYLDSLHTLADGLSANSSVMSAFDEINLSKTRVSSSLSLNLTSVTNIYKYNIYNELIPILTSRKTITAPPVELNYEATAAFSGIIIYAADPLPYYGENASGLLQPAIFPKIFTENMEIVASADMADPKRLSEWGFIQYTESLSQRDYEHRVGLYPFITTARGIFGNNRTDILIPDEDAKKILYNKANRRLIEEGRIVIIIGKL